MHSSSTGVVSESSSPTTAISAKEKLANTGGSEVSGKTPGAAASSEKHKRKGKERQVDARHDALADEEENKNDGVITHTLKIRLLASLDSLPDRSHHHSDSTRSTCRTGTRPTSRHVR